MREIIIAPQNYDQSRLGKYLIFMAGGITNGSKTKRIDGVKR